MCGIAGICSFAGSGPAADRLENLAIRDHLAASGSNAAVRPLLARLLGTSAMRVGALTARSSWSTNPRPSK